MTTKRKEDKAGQTLRLRDGRRLGARARSHTAQMLQRPRRTLVCRQIFQALAALLARALAGASVRTR
jgi:hypothetical protein